MLFALAIGIACFQVLGGLCFLVAALASIAVMKQFIIPNEGLDIGQMMIVATLFAGGGVGCFWAAKFIRRIAKGD